MAIQLCVDELIAHKVWKEDDPILTIVVFPPRDVNVECSSVD